MKIDLHTNIGLFPSSAASRKIVEATGVDEMALFLRTNKITHHACLYPTEEYFLMEELAAKVPEVTHYGIQVIPGKDREHPTDIKTVKLDILDPKKTLCAGVKFASHRGFWLRDGKVEAGLDYGIYHRQINSLLKRVPENALVCFHMQGEPAYNTGANAHSVAQIALKFPHLKFILNHMGDYAIKGMKPKKYYFPGLNSAFPHKYAYSRACIGACVEYSNLAHNIWLETSILIKHKLEFIKQAKYWCLGSDYPFIRTSNFFLGQERILINALGEEVLSDSYKKTLEWLQQDWRELLKQHIISMGYEDNLETFEFPQAPKRDSNLC